MVKTGFLQNKYAPHWVSACFFILAVILNLNISFSVNDWKNLTDPYDYLYQSKISLLDNEFYFPHKTAHFDPRPFTVPLFYKLCGSDTDAIVHLQMLMVPLSAFFMLAAFMQFIEKNSTKYFLIIGVYLLMGWWNVLGWSTLVLSESLSTSLLFCWLASLLFLYKKNSPGWWLLHVFVTVLFAFTRDSWPYVLIVFYAVFSLLWWWFKQPGLKNYITMLVLSISIFFIQQHSARVGLRYQLPVINSIAVRILPKPEYVAWFVKNGMPMAEKLQQHYGKLNVATEADQHQLWDLYSDSTYQPFLDWVVEKGQHVYTRFLITHPTFTLGMDESPAQLSRILSYNLFYIDVHRGYTAYIEPLFPLFNVGVVTVLCIMLLMIYTKRRNPALLAPVLLALFTLLNVILSYNADALEVERHLYTTIILIQLTGFWAVAMIWDALAWRSKQTSSINTFYVKRAE